MEFDGAAPCQVTHNEIFSSSSLAEGSMPAFLSQSGTAFSLPVLWVTEDKPRFPPHVMTEIAHVVMKVWSSLTDDDLVDITDVTSPSPEDIRRNSRIVTPDSRKDKAWVIYRRFSSDAATESGKVLNSWNLWRGERMVSCEHFPFSGDNNPQDFSFCDLGGRVYLDLPLKLECTRTETQTTAKLTIKSMDLGMGSNCLKCTSRNVSCESTCGQIFVKKVGIAVRPDDWAKVCGEREPYGTAKVFHDQYSSSLSVQLGFHPKSYSFTNQSSKGVTYEAPTFEWGPATRRLDRKTVDWTWELKKAANGDKIDYNTTLWSKSPLGFNPNKSTLYRGDLSATWDGPPQVDLQKLQQNWHMTVTVQTAVVTGNRLPVGSRKVKRGPTIAFSHDELTFM